MFPTKLSLAIVGWDIQIAFGIFSISTFFIVPAPGVHGQRQDVFEIKQVTSKKHLGLLEATDDASR